MKQLFLLILGTCAAAWANYPPDACNESYKEEVVCTVTGPDISEGGLWLEREYYEQNPASPNHCANDHQSVLSAEITVSLTDSSSAEGDGMGVSYGPSDSLSENASNFVIQRIDHVSMYEPKTLDVHSAFSVSFKKDSELTIPILISNEPVEVHLQCKVVN